MNSCEVRGGQRVSSAFVCLCSSSAFIIQSLIIFNTLSSLLKHVPSRSRSVLAVAAVALFKCSRPVGRLVINWTAGLGL